MAMTAELESSFPNLFCSKNAEHNLKLRDDVMRAKLLQAEGLVGFLSLISLLSCGSTLFLLLEWYLLAPCKESSGQGAWWWRGRHYSMSSVLLSWMLPLLSLSSTEVWSFAMKPCEVPHSRMCLNPAKKDPLSFCKKQPPKVPQVGVLKSSDFAN